MGYQLWEKMSLKIEKAGRTTGFPALFEPRVLPAPNAPNHRPPTFSHPDGRGKCIHFGLPRVLQRRVP